MPDQSKPFQIESDSSKVATGTVLTQLNSNGNQHPVAFLSKTFSETKRKYEIHDRELLGIIQALKEWRHYIQGSGHTTIVYSNHNDLMYFQTAQKLNDWQARLSLYLSGFDLKLIHLPETRMVQSDTLSRQPDYGTDKWIEEEDKVVLPDNLFINLLDTELQEWILNGKELDLDVKNTIETLIEEGPTSLKNDLQDWKVEEIDGQKTIFFKGKNYILKDLKLWRDIVKMYHNHKTARHPGELETYNGIRQNYWWPGLRTFVKGRGICQQFKINRSLSNPVYIAIKGANNTRPFVKCSMDLITDLLPVEGYNSILVVVDQGLSKAVILCPCVKTITWEGTVTLLWDNLFKRFGLPDEIISDRDPRFAAHAFQELLKLLNIKLNLTTAYHPQSDGATKK
jgi:RNase H-like domain found in reverse transcriptase/Integrase zinc binding domain/Integrase core domain